MTQDVYSANQIREARRQRRATVIETVLEWAFRRAPSKALRTLPIVLLLSLCALYAIAPNATLFHRPLGLITLADIACLWPLVKVTALLTYLFALVSTANYVFALSKTMQNQAHSDKSLA